LFLKIEITTLTVFRWLKSTNGVLSITYLLNLFIYSLVDEVFSLVTGGMINLSEIVEFSDVYNTK